MQHIEARVTFSLGVHSKSDNDYKFWHARRMAFIQCSLTGTALRWYFRLHDTSDKIGTLLYNHLKNNFPSENPLLCSSRSP